MCDDKMQKCVLLLHYWKKELNATEVVRQINYIEVNIRQAQRLFKRFKEGDTSLERIEGSSSFDSQKLCESIEKNPTTSTRITLGNTENAK